MDTSNRQPQKIKATQRTKMLQKKGVNISPDTPPKRESMKYGYMNDKL